MLYRSDSPSNDSRQALLAAARRQAEVLADYPLLALLSDDASAGPSLCLVVELIEHWIGELDLWLADVGPASGDVSQRMRERLLATRAGLAGLLELAQRLAEADGTERIAGQHPAGVQARFVPAIGRHGPTARG